MTLAAVAGAVTADRAARRSAVDTGGWDGVLGRAGVALAATLGAIAGGALAAAPAAALDRPDSYAPQAQVLAFVLAGATLGLLATGPALMSRAIRGNILATGGWLWVLAIVAGLDRLAAGQPWPVRQPGLWSVTADGPWLRSLYLPGAVIATVAAAVIGFFAAWRAIRLGAARITVVLSGAAGPALVVIAYLLAAPHPSLLSVDALDGALIAPYTVLAGLAGAAVAAVLPERRTSVPMPPVPAARKPRPAHPVAVTSPR